MSLESLQRMIAESNNTVFFGGAGVSTESGIPDFRSSQGVYEAIKAFGERPEVLLSLPFFRYHPDQFYRFYKDKMLYPHVRPNEAHRALARMEIAGKLTAVVTQNIDGLHQEAGSRNVMELHGSVHRNHCLSCGKSFTLDEVLHSSDIVPRCACGGIIKPDVVLYGESLDAGLLEQAGQALSRAELVIIGGTSLSVQPAAGLLRACRGKRVLINLSPTPLDQTMDLVLRESIGSILGSAYPEQA